jgi:hypothetical protein
MKNRAFRAMAALPILPMPLGITAVSTWPFTRNASISFARQA